MSQDSETRTVLTAARSCLECRRRKIRCDKRLPCSYCTKVHIQCTYSKAPRLSQASASSSSDALAVRVGQLESVVHRLESKLGETSRQPQPDSMQPTSFDNVSTHVSKGQSDVSQNLQDESGRRRCGNEQSPRYATHSLWSELDQQESSESRSWSSQTAIQGNASATVFDTAIMPHDMYFSQSDLSGLHPRPEHVFALWQLYLENVDPVLKLLHTPTIQRVISKATLNRQKVEPPTECLMFAIYYAAVTSLPADQLRVQLLQEDRSTLLERYRQGMNKALDKARFMETRDITVLQAFVLFLICARTEGRTPVWALTSVAVRIATRLSLHRDPQALQFSPFDCEMRRRLWWQIMTLDVRCAEDADLDPLISEHQFDTKFPTNMNDAELHEDMTQYPTASSGRTEMFFTLARFQISYAVRKFMFSTEFTIGNQYALLGEAQNKIVLIDQLKQELDRKWSDQCDLANPICFLTVTANNLVLAKLRLLLQRPSSLEMLRKDPILNNYIMQNSVEIITHAQKLRGNSQYQRWTWLFQRYIEWDALAMLFCSILASQSIFVPLEACAALDECIHAWKNVHLDEMHEKRWNRILALNAQVQQTKIRSPSMETNNVRDNAVSTSAPQLRDVVSGPVQTNESAVTPGGHLCAADTVLPNNAGFSQSDWDFSDFTAQGLFSWDLDLNSPDINTWI